MNGNERIAPAVTRSFAVCATILASTLVMSQAASAKAVKWSDEIAALAAEDEDIAGFYAATENDALWTGRDRADKKRRKALLRALEEADSHGLPAARYDAAGLEEMFRKARSKEEKAAVEVAFSKAFVRYATDLQKGIIIPSRAATGILRRPAAAEPVVYLNGISSGKPDAYLEGLAPSSQQYARLRNKLIELSKDSAANSEKFKSVAVALERERWLPETLGQRHVLVNLPEFKARIVDGETVAFETKSVIGKNKRDQRTPEFSDEMEHMVINPSWYVPKSIVTKEYLPKMQESAENVSHIALIDDGGNVVDRSTVDFGAYTKDDFPYGMRQSPGASNALGKVKFMFPNRNNIYLHDTPAKALFGRDVRAFSHGCIRLEQPFEFAYTMLEPQQAEEKEFFNRILNTGYERQVDLEKFVPVHLIYRTAFFAPGEENIAYFDDIYGRDAKIWKALSSEGVVVAEIDAKVSGKKRAKGGRFLGGLFSKK